MVKASKGFDFLPHKPEGPTFAEQKWAWTGVQPGEHELGLWVHCRAALSRTGALKTPQFSCTSMRLAGGWHAVPLGPSRCLHLHPAQPDPMPPCPSSPG